jgi:hypothetical protein
MHAYDCSELEKAERNRRQMTLALERQQKAVGEHGVASFARNFVARKPEQGSLAGAKGLAGAAVARTMAA